jgi:CRISPR-associated protein Cas2
VDPAQWTGLRSRLIESMDKDKDSLRFYFLGANWRNRVEHVGAKPALDPEGPLVL